MPTIRVRLRVNTDESIRSAFNRLRNLQHFSSTALFRDFRQAWAREARATVVPNVRRRLPVDTGRLRSSVDVRISGTGIELVALTTIAPYAYLVHRRGRPDERTVRKVFESRTTRRLMREAAAKAFFQAILAGLAAAAP